MTPKEAYEARKAERIAARGRLHPQQSTADLRQSKDEAMEDMFDRFITAVERIADALETKDARSVAKEGQ